MIILDSLANDDGEITLQALADAVRTDTVEVGWRTDEEVALADPGRRASTAFDVPAFQELSTDARTGAIDSAVRLLMARGDVAVQDGDQVTLLGALAALNVYLRATQRQTTMEVVQDGESARWLVFRRAGTVSLVEETRPSGLHHFRFCSPERERESLIEVLLDGTDIGDEPLQELVRGEAASPEVQAAAERVRTEAASSAVICAATVAADEPRGTLTGSAGIVTVYIAEGTCTLLAGDEEHVSMRTCGIDALHTAIAHMLP